MIFTTQGLFDLSCWWEKGKWPVVKGDEIKAALFEDLRRRMWLIRNLYAGGVDVTKQYGIQLPWDGTGTPPEQPGFVPFDNSNWESFWLNLGSFNPLDPGLKIVLFEDITGHADLYINADELSQELIAAHPPVKTTGVIDEMWRLYPNPNKYHHYDYNAGRPSINADHRYFVRYHPKSSGYCLGTYEAYVCIEPAYSWYPRQADFLKQLPSIKRGGIITERDKRVEIKRETIFQAANTHWDRTKTPIIYPEHKCIRAKRVNEYVLKDGDPKDWLTAEEGSEIGQNYSDPLINEAYQDQIVHVCEFQEQFIKEANAAWIKSWVHFNARYTWAWIPDYQWNIGDIVWVSDYDSGLEYKMNAFYICMEGYTATSEGPKKPGTPAGENYWKTPAFQPTYFKGHNPYCRLRDTGILQGLGGTFGKVDPAEHWDCNGSAFELLLREIDPEGFHYDWYWDTVHPYVPDWMYHEHYHMPGGQPDLYPIPRGCWRRIWKYTMERPCHPVTK